MGVEEQTGNLAHDIDLVESAASHLGKSKRRINRQPPQVSDLQEAIGKEDRHRYRDWVEDPNLERVPTLAAIAAAPDADCISNWCLRSHIGNSMRGDIHGPPLGAHGRQPAFRSDGVKRKQAHRWECLAGWATVSNTTLMIEPFLPVLAGTIDDTDWNDDYQWGHGRSTYRDGLDVPPPTSAPEALQASLGILRETEERLWRKVQETLREATGETADHDARIARRERFARWQPVGDTIKKRRALPVIATEVPWGFHHPDPRPTRNATDRGLWLPGLDSRFLRWLFALEVPVAALMCRASDFSPNPYGNERIRAVLHRVTLPTGQGPASDSLVDTLLHPDPDETGFDAFANGFRRYQTLAAVDGAPIDILACYSPEDVVGHTLWAMPPGSDTRSVTSVMRAIRACGLARSAGSVRTTVKQVSDSFGNLQKISAPHSRDLLRTLAVAGHAQHPAAFTAYLKGMTQARQG